MGSVVDVVGEWKAAKSTGDAWELVEDFSNRDDMMHDLATSLYLPVDTDIQIYMLADTDHDLSNLKSLNLELPSKFD